MKPSLAIVIVVSLSACSDPHKSDPGAKLFAENCAVCHGSDAKGGGVIGDVIPVTPPDLTKLTQNNDGTFPLLHVMSTIDGFSHKELRNRPGMPEFGTLLNTPVVLFDSGDGIETPTPEPLVDIALYLMSIQD